MKQYPTWVTIRYSGKAKTFETMDEVSLLEQLYEEWSHAGGGHDHPEILIKNGVIVIDKDENLTDIIFQYGQIRNQINKEATDKLNDNAIYLLKGNI